MGVNKMTKVLSLLGVWIALLTANITAYAEPQDMVEPDRVMLPPPDPALVVPDPLSQHLTKEQKDQIRKMYQEPDLISGGQQETEEEHRRHYEEVTLPCPDREDVRISPEDVKEARKFGALNPEAWVCAMKDSWLWRHNGPDYGADPELVSLYLRNGKYDVKKMTKEVYEQKAKDAPKKWPNHRYAHELRYQVLKPDPAKQKEALDALKKSAYLGLDAGYVLFYQQKMSEMTVNANDAETARDYFERALERGKDSFQKAQTLATYGETISAWDSVQAKELIKKAVDQAPDPETKERFLHKYLRFLIDEGDYQKALDRIDVPETPELMDKQGMKDVYHQLRCEALRGLGRHEEANKECRKAQDLSKELYKDIDPKMMAMLTGKQAPAACAHDENLQDDCRQSNGLIPPPPQDETAATCEKYPGDPTNLCYANYLWNLAELVQSEANGETYGSKVAVAWTVRNRVNRETSNSGQFPGTSGNCAFNCAFPGDPTLCSWQKRYCCNIHSGQFFREHLPTSAPAGQKRLELENVRLVFSVAAGRTANPQTAWMPPNTFGTVVTGCPNYNYTAGFTSVNACTKEQLVCPEVDTFSSATEYRNLMDWDVYGPYYFYANCVAINGVTHCFQCRGFQSGDFIEDIPHDYVVVGYPGPTCENDPPFANNCYGRLSRKRLFKAGNPNDFQGRSSTVLPPSPSQPDRITLPGNQGSNSFIYRLDVPHGGGKEVRIEMKVESGSGHALVQVYLQRQDGPVVYYFGEIATNNGSWNTKTFTSSIPVSWEGSVLSIFNLGTRPVTIRDVTFID